MNRLVLSMFVISTLALFAPAPLKAQTPRASPHETIHLNLNQDNNRVTIVYGRPFSKNRVIWGTLVPYGKVWRMGADEATLLIMQQPIVIGETTVPAGAYTLALQPEENGMAKLIINKQIGQWGVPYSGQATELARVDMKKEPMEKEVDQFTMALEKNPAGGGILKLMWEKTQYSVAFTTKK